MSWRRTLTRKSQQHFLCIDVPEQDYNTTPPVSMASFM
jgi:hypothetical protein